jgi:Fur family ferric uptake transcriptional regulator
MIAATQSNHPLAAVSTREVTRASLAEARNRIRTAGMRVTKPRVALIESLLRMQGPVSIERIHQEVGAKSCDLVTIYRCLAAFENLGLVRRSYLHNGTCLYEQTISTARRYHIICKDCGRSEPVEYTPAEGVEQQLQERGYAHISHVVEFFGICPACQQAAKAPARGESVIIAPSV